MFRGSTPLAEYQDVLSHGRALGEFDRTPPAVPNISAGERTLSPGAELLRIGLDYFGRSPVADDLVDEILHRHVELKRWKRTPQVTRKLGAISILERDTGGVDVVPPVIENSCRRNAIINGKRLLIITQQIHASDICDIFDFERVVKDPLADPITNNKHASELMRVFTNFGYGRHNNRENKASPKDEFTIAERAVLGLITHTNTLKEMGNLLGVDESTLSRLLHPIREAYGIAKESDLVLFSIAAGASVEHVAAEATKSLSETHLSFFKSYFSFDPAVRAEARSISSGTIGSAFKRAADRAGVSGSKELIKCLVRDGHIAVPDLGAFKALKDC